MRFFLDSPHSMWVRNDWILQCFWMFVRGVIWRRCYCAMSLRVNWMRSEKNTGLEMFSLDSP